MRWMREKRAGVDKARYSWEMQIPLWKSVGLSTMGFIGWTAPGRKAPAWWKGSELGISSPITHCALWSSFSLVCEVGFATAPMTPSELGAWSEKREGGAPQSAWHW